MAKGITDTSNYSDIADAIRGKNGSQDTYKPSEMPAAITAIPSGGGGVGIPREIDSQGVFQAPSSSFSFTLPSNATSIGRSSFYYGLGGSTGLTSVDCSSLLTAPNKNSFSYAFSGCTSLASANFSSLQTIGETVFYYAFDGCTSLTTVNFNSLSSITATQAFAYAFNGCTSLKTVSFPSLSSMPQTNVFYFAFKDCTSLTSLSFPALTVNSFGNQASQFTSMLKNVDGCTVHFPASIQSKIGSWNTVTSGFGGTNTTVLFDL